jgi:arylsulfatase A-like enzyme
MPHLRREQAALARDRPNVLLVVLDTARADATEPYGSAAGTTPTLADLASRGTAVRSAYAPSSWTLPSHASMFTGLMPRSLGLGQAPDGRPPSCAPVVAAHRDRYLPELLRRDGWATRGVSANVWVSKASGLSLGFEQFRQVSGDRRTTMGAEGTTARLRWALHALHAKADAGAQEAREEVQRWLGERPTQPFFWFVNLLECHSPYLPPKPWNDLGPVGRIRAGDEARHHLTLHAIWRASLAGLPVPPEALARMRSLYQRAVSMMDSWLADVLEELDRRKVLDDTVVLVTSDHGENFGEDGLMGHAFSLDERLVRIPFVAAGPGDWDADAITSLVDVPRLLSGAVGLKGAPYDDDPRTPGIAVSTLDPLASRDHPSTLDAKQRWDLGERGVGMLSDPASAATDGRWKVVRDTLGERAYDVSADPLGIAPLPLTAVPEAPRRALLDAVDAAASGTATPLDSTPVGTTDVDVEQLEAQLRLLGYL